MTPQPLINRRSPRKIAEPRSANSAVPKRTQLIRKSRVSERDSTHAPSRLLSKFMEGRFCG
jgi:hypothetical protein